MANDSKKKRHKKLLKRLEKIQQQNESYQIQSDSAHSRRMALNPSGSYGSPEWKNYEHQKSILDTEYDMASMSVRALYAEAEEVSEEIKKLEQEMEYDTGLPKDPTARELTVFRISNILKKYGEKGRISAEIRELEADIVANEKYVAETDTGDNLGMTVSMMIGDSRRAIAKDKARQDELREALNDLRELDNALQNMDAKREHSQSESELKLAMIELEKLKLENENLKEQRLAAQAARDAAALAKAQESEQFSAILKSLKDDAS